jgi:hypothetical protein
MSCSPADRVASSRAPRPQITGGAVGNNDLHLFEIASFPLELGGNKLGITAAYVICSP